YLLPLTVLGALVAGYHVLEQNIPGFGAPEICSQGVPCSTKYIDWLGFISIPVLSLTAFLLITLLLAGVWRAGTARTEFHADGLRASK
ncbi:MAG TPA: hypothetical protein VF171_08155, partial [Trueperaceae bacterium]